VSVTVRELGATTPAATVALSPYVMVSMVFDPEGIAITTSRVVTSSATGPRLVAPGGAVMERVSVNPTGTGVLSWAATFFTPAFPARINTVLDASETGVGCAPATAVAMRKVPGLPDSRSFADCAHTA
jgi:hypothetical protein